MTKKPRWVHAVSVEGDCEWALVAREMRGRVPMASVTVLTGGGWEMLQPLPHALSKELALRAFTWHEEDECPRSDRDE